MNLKNSLLYKGYIYTGKKALLRIAVIGLLSKSPLCFPLIVVFVLPVRFG